jgi:hypothetical protein
LDNNYLDALVTALFAILTLSAVAGFLIISTVIMHRSMAMKDKRGGFNLIRGGRRAKKDSKRDVLIAAAVAGYLQAERERKL